MKFIFPLPAALILALTPFASAQWTHQSPGDALSGPRYILPVDEDWTTGTKTVLFIRAGFPDRPEDTLEEAPVYAAMKEVADYFVRMSQGKLELQPTVLEMTVWLEDESEHFVESELRGKAVRNATVRRMWDVAPGRLADYDLSLVWFPKISEWEEKGGGSLGSTGAWVNGTLEPHAIAQQLARNFGLPPSNALAPVNGEFEVSNRLAGADPADLMGDTDWLAPINPWYRTALHWFQPGEDWRYVFESGVYRLYRHDIAAAEQRLRGIRLGVNRTSWIAPFWSKSFYWVDLQEESWRRGGVAVRRGMLNGHSYGDAGADLLDMSPDSPDGIAEYALRAGSEYFDPAEGIRIEVVAIGGAGPDQYADVRITFEREPWVVEMPHTFHGNETGGSVDFHVVVGGDPPFEYQWLRGGEPIAGETSATLRLGDLRFADTAVYQLYAHTPRGELVTEKFHLAVPPEESFDAAIDPTFTSRVGEGRVVAMVIDTEDRILIAGEFDEVDGVPRKNIARLLPDGQLDPNFAPELEMEGSVRDIALHRDGKIVVTGGSWNYRTEDGRGWIVQFQEDGTPDPDFIGGVRTDAPIGRAVTQPDRRILIGGRFWGLDGESSARLRRLMPDGSPDPDFDGSAAGPPGFVEVLDIHLQGDGRIIAHRERRGTGWGDMPGRSVLRLEPDGTPESFSLPGWSKYGIRGVDLYERNGVTKAYYMLNEANIPVVRVTLDGELDPHYYAPGWHNSSLAAFAPLPDGRAYALARFYSVSGRSESFLIRLTQSGDIDRSFAPVRSRKHLIGIQSTGDIVLGGGNSVRRLRADHDRLNYAMWAVAHGFESEPSATDRGPHQVAPLFLYAFGLDGRDPPDPASLPTLAVGAPSGDAADAPHLALRFRRLTLADDLVYRVEVSENLGDWSSLAPNAIEKVNETDVGVEEVTVFDVLPIGDSQKRFLRLRVERSQESVY